MKGIRLTCALTGALAITAGIAGANIELPAERTPTAIAPAPAATVSAVRTAAAKRRDILPQREIECIASAVWHEAGNQPRVGQIAVAEVVMRRRASNGRFPRDACRVIAQPRQFSFVRAGVIPKVPAKQATRMRRIALGVVDGSLRSPVRGAMFFHATYVSPRWGMTRAGQVGDHVFYN